MPKVRMQFCPECRRGLDGAKVLGEDDSATPGPGDITLCLYCATVLSFDKDGTLRRATKRDLKKFDREQKQLIARAVVLLKTQHWKRE